MISLGLGKTKKLNVFRRVWAGRKVILDKVDPKIRRNFERRGWLPLLDVEHPPPVALIKEFYSILSIQWWSQEFRLGGARLKDNIGNKKLI